MNLALWLERTARAMPDRAALGEGRRVVATYRELGESVARLGGGLAALGLAPGDRVGIVARNAPDYAEAFFAIWHAGLAAVPINAKLHGAELAYVLEHSGTRACFVGDDLLTILSGHAPAALERVIVLGSAEHARLRRHDPVPVVDRSDDALAWLFYTSGTTGRPKGAMLTHGNVAAASFAYALEVDPVAAGDAILHAAPMSHGSGLYMMAHVLRGAANVVPESGGFEPAEVAEALGAWPGLSMFAAPTMVKRLVAAPSDYAIANLRAIVCGGAPLYAEDAAAALDRFGPRLAQIYGQGESPMTIARMPAAEFPQAGAPDFMERLASCGRAFGCIEMTVVAEDGGPVPEGGTGEVTCRGPTVMAGYWHDEEATAATLRGGWLHTGDVGSLDASGSLTLKDRSKDVIISGGTNIYPREVEEVLLAHPAIREVSVIGRPDGEWGEVVVAYVVGETAPAELDALCLSRIARFKRPKDYVFVESLPKNNYGKIVKTELRALDRAAAEGTPDGR